MSEVDENTLIQVQDKDGNIKNILPITKRENVYGIDELEADLQSHLSKIDDLNTKQQKALTLLAANCFVLDDTNGKTYKIGSADGDFYYMESDVKITDIINAITKAVGSL